MRRGKQAHETRKEDERKVSFTVDDTLNKKKTLWKNGMNEKKDYFLTTVSMVIVFTPI